MRIRIINENDWEKVYEFDKSIIRIGSQVSCDIQLRDQYIQPLEMQIVRSGDSDITYVARFFADNIMLTRGDQTFPVTQVTAYDILDGDKIVIGSYRLILSFEDERTRVRTSTHMSAELFLTKRELALESSINGMLLLKNLGTEKPCQFRMRMTGIPNDCFQSAPLPLLYPGSSSTVGFIISHLRTKPAPGFHTFSIVVTAPDDYFGEILEFNQDIYVHAVFDNTFVLEDDSQELSGFNAEQAKQVKDSEQKIPIVGIPDTRRLNVDAEMTTEEKHVETPVRIIGSNDAENSDIFQDQEEENVTAYTSSRKKPPVVVVHSDSTDAFTDDSENTVPVSSGNNNSSADVVIPYRKIVLETDEDQEKPSSPDVSSVTDKTSAAEEVPAAKKKKSKKADQFVMKEDTAIVPSEEDDSGRQAEEKPDAPKEPENRDPEMQEPGQVKKPARRKKANASADTPVETPAAEPVESQENEVKSEKPDVLIIKGKPDEAFTPETKAGEETSQDANAERIVSGAEKTKENQKSDNLPLELEKGFSEADIQNPLVIPDLENKSGQVQKDNSEPVEAEIIPKSGDTEKLFDNEETDISPDEHSGVKKEKSASSVSARSRKGDGFDIPSSENSEMEPSETVDKGKTGRKKPAKPQFVSSKGSGGNTQVAVVSGEGSFDDSAGDFSDDRQETQNESRPEVVVVKGGGFDD